MRIVNLSALAITLIMAARSPLVAGTVEVMLKGVNGASNGPYYVLPYNLTVGGAEVAADCYDFFDQVTIGERWNASADTLAEASAAGMFAADSGAFEGYELIGALATLATPTTQSKIELQEAIWDVFDPGEFGVTPGMAADIAAAQAKIPAFNFNRVEFLEPLAGEHTQAFVVIIDPPPVPEPSAWRLTAIALTAGGMYSLRRTLGAGISQKPRPRLRTDQT